MTTKSPYRKGVKINSKKSSKILKYFCLDFTATNTSKILGIKRRTINERYNYYRNVIYRYSLREGNEVMNGIIEMDESYFLPTRVKGKRGRGAGGKIKVFGLLKSVTHIVDEMKTSTLLVTIRDKAEIESAVNTNKFMPYDGLVDLGYKGHHRVNHGEKED